MNARKTCLNSMFVLIVLSELASGIAWPVTDEDTKQSNPSTVALSGWFTILWGDSSTGVSSEPRFQLTDENGNVTRLLLDQSQTQELGGMLSFNGKLVSVEGNLATTFSDNDAPEVLNVSLISLSTLNNNEALQADVLALVSGSKPWVSIMCKFNDFSIEPRSLAFFQGMYSGTEPGLDHYWREQSYDTANIAGSTAAGWFVLPHSEAHYNPTDTGQGTDLDSLANDCIAAADPSVNFALYSGINMMFNTDFDNGWAWGGSQYMTLDGVSNRWSTTWEPPWGYSDITVIAHEMGHGFGLPHSSGAYGQTYDNQWDVMSSTWSNCNRSTDAIYGCLGQHTISYHKNRLGWIAPAQKYIAGPGTNITLTLERLGLPSTDNYKMVKIPISGSETNFYTVEARRQTGYDNKLPGQAVIIHEVDTTRYIPAHVIDPDGNGNTGDVGAMWVAGETFSDAPNQISVSVLSATSTGYQVNINLAGPSPDAVTHAASNIGQTIATLNGSADPNDSDTSAWFQWGTNDTYGQTTPSVNVGSGSNPVTYSRTISGLSCGGETYHFRAVANSIGGTAYGSDRSFATSACSYFIGGSVSGLVGTGLVLRNNNGDDLPISADGDFTFTTALNGGIDYAVTVETQPTGPNQTCSVNRGSGTEIGTDITDVTVSCTIDRFSIGGSVNGLQGSNLVLKSSTGDELTIAEDSDFTFATPLDDGSSYAVSVKIQPTSPNQKCSVSDGNGALRGADITDISINCGSPYVILFKSGFE